MIEEIIRAAEMSVQLAGGMRTREQVERWIDKGVGRVVIGTLAAREPKLVKELATLYPDQIVLSVDVWQGFVMTDGWRSQSVFTPEAFIDAFEGHAVCSYRGDGYRQRYGGRRSSAWSDLGACQPSRAPR